MFPHSSNRSLHFQKFTSRWALRAVDALSWIWSLLSCTGFVCVCSLWLIEYNFVHLQIRSNAECIVGQYFIPGSTPLTLAHNQTLFHTAYCSHTEQHTAHCSTQHTAHCSSLLKHPTQRSMKMHHTYCEPHTNQTSRFTFLFILPAWLVLHKLQCNPHNFVKI